MDIGDRQSVPFPRSYWVVPGKFLAGYYPGSRNREQAHQKLEALLKHGIRHMISLMETDEHDGDAKSFVSYKQQMTSTAESMGGAVTFDRMPIKDLYIPSRSEMCQILDRIDECIQDNRPVFVHC